MPAKVDEKTPITCAFGILPKTSTEIKSFFNPFLTVQSIFINIGDIVPDALPFRNRCLVEEQTIGIDPQNKHHYEPMSNLKNPGFLVKEKQGGKSQHQKSQAGYIRVTRAASQ